MNPTETTVDRLVVKSQIDGIMEMTISDWEPKKISESRVPIVYNGLVKSGTGSSAIDACIFCYMVRDNDNLIPEMLHEKCSAISHPNVMRSLGYGRGRKEYSDFMFVAFPKFEKTLSDYSRKASGATEMGRFSTAFIQIARDTVYGLVGLSQNDFGCPELKATQIAIMTEGNSLTAKIWNFFECNSAKLKDKAWFRLGQFFCDVMFNNASASLEINDLCRKMVDGKLKGIVILEQSALLTVQEKFENVLALWRHVSLNCERQLGQQGSGQGLPQVGHRTGAESSKMIISYTLDEYLDLDGTIANRPEWIGRIRTGQQPGTFRELLDELRDIIEHEDEYIPPSEDLEYWFRDAWEKDFLKIQLWASDPNLKLKEDKRP